MKFVIHMSEDPLIVKTFSKIPYTQGALFSASDFLWHGGILTGRLPPEKGFNPVEYYFFKKYTEYYDHRCPGKQIRRIQINLRQIQCSTDGMAGSANHFRRHSGLPAHSQR